MPTFTRKLTTYFRYFRRLSFFLVLFSLSELTIQAQDSFILDSLSKIEEIYGSNAEVYDYSEIIQIEKLIEEQKFKEAEKLISQLMADLPLDPVLISLKMDVIGQIRDKFIALNYITELIKQNPESDVFYFIRGLYQFKKSYNLTAKDDFLKALEINPDNTQAIMQLYRLFLEEGDYQSSLDHLKRAIQVEPDNAVFHFLAARMFMYFKKVSSAIKSIHKAVEIDPSSIPYMEFAITLHLQLKNIRDAKKLLLQALEENAGHNWFINQYSALLISEKKFDSVDEFLRVGMADFPKAESYPLNIGYLKIYENELDTAAEYFQKTLDINPENMDAKSQLYWIYWKQEKYRKAIPILEYLVEKKTNDVTAYIYLARYYNSENRIYTVEDVILQGLEVFPENKNLLYEYAIVLRKRKSFKQAISILEELVDKYPDNAYFNGDLGILYFEIENFALAESYLERSVRMNSKVKTFIQSYIDLLYLTNKKEKLNALAQDDSLDSVLQSRLYYRLALLDNNEYNMLSAMGNINKALTLQNSHPEYLTLEAEILANNKDYESALYSIEDSLSKGRVVARLFVKLSLLLATNKDDEALKIIADIELKNNPILFTHLVKKYLKNGDEFLQEFFEDEELIIAFKKIVRSASYIENEQVLNTISEKHKPYLQIILHTKFDSLPQDISIDDLGDIAQLSRSQLYILPYYFYGNYTDEYDFTLKLLDQYEKKYGLEPEMNGIKADVSVGLKKYNQAIPYFNKYREFYPDSMWAKSLQAYAYDFIGRSDEAEALLEEVLIAMPNDTLALNNLAWLYVISNNKDPAKLNKAAELSAKAIKLNPASDNLDTRAEVLYQQGKYDEALIMIEKALAVDNRNFDHFKKQRKKILKAIQEGIKDSE